MIFGLTGVTLLKGGGYLSSSPVPGELTTVYGKLENISQTGGQFLAKFFEESARDIVWAGCLVYLKMGQ